MEKYIVYQTTNLVNNKIYIGVHKTNDPNTFDGYIGCGVYINKTSTYEHAKTKFQRAVKKYGIKNFKRQVLQIYNTAEEAYYVESILVDEEFLKRPDVYNMVLGGEMAQYKVVPTYQYDFKGNFIAEFPTIKDAAYNINIRPSTLCQAILFKRSCKNFYWSSEKVAKLNISEYNKPKEMYEVHIYNLDGTYYKSYESCNAAGKDLNVFPVDRAARLGHVLGKKYYASFIKCATYSEANTIYTKTRKVYKYNIDGDFICEYDSQNLAEAQNKGSNISKAIKSKKPDSNNFMWALDKMEKFNTPARNKPKNVGMFDSDGNLIKTWKSGRQCSLEYGRGVYHCLNGEYDTHKGYIFKYIN